MPNKTNNICTIFNHKKIRIFHDNLLFLQLRLYKQFHYYEFTISIIIAINEFCVILISSDNKCVYFPIYKKLKCLPQDIIKIFIKIL